MRYGFALRRSTRDLSKTEASHHTPATATTSISHRKTSAKNAGVNSGSMN
jgi:hypothetical protein